MHLNFSHLSPGPTFAQHLANAGYTVGVFGKYLNRNPMRPDGLPHIPTGVHTWLVSPGDEADKSTEADPSGEYFPSFYYDSSNAESMMWDNVDAEYETAFLGNRSIVWMRDAAANSTPFFLYLAPHSPHGMALPAPWYTDLQINGTAPRPPSWNYSAADHHWLISQQKPLTMPEAAALDKHFAERWRCLRATDDLLLALDAALSELDLWKSTYIFFTADHGLEPHISTPAPPRAGMLIWGPRLTQGAISASFGSEAGSGTFTIRMCACRCASSAPAFTPARRSGWSDRTLISRRRGSAWPASRPLPTWTADRWSTAWSTLMPRTSRTPSSRTCRRARRALVAAAPGAFCRRAAPTSNTSEIAPFRGITSNPVPSPIGLKQPFVVATLRSGLGPTGGASAPWYRQQDAFNNTYRALRVIDRRPGGLGNVLYAEFGSFDFATLQFHEFYEMDSDRWQQRNRYGGLTPGESRPTAALPMENPYCSCGLTRDRSR